MDRSRALELLRESNSMLSSRYRVTRLALFGSTARDEAREDSDVDVLVAFDGPATPPQYFGVQFYLEDCSDIPSIWSQRKRCGRNCGHSSRKKPSLSDERGRPWRFYLDDMIGFATRNRLIHGYLGLDDDVLWSIIQDDVPALLVEPRALTAKLQ